MEGKKWMKLMLATIAGACLLPVAASAQVSGQCADCHTMHNSQNAVAIDGSGPNEALTNADCIGCHSDATAQTIRTGAGGSNTPIVLYTGGAPTTTLAGGNFYWVGTTLGADDTMGHNVYPGTTTATDTNLGTTPPGDDAYGGTFTGNLTCAGTTGCHGDRDVAGDFASISGAHHTPDTTITGASVGTSYRFLGASDGAAGVTDGILGLEDADWENTASATDHNQYFGQARTTTTGDVIGNEQTISSLCAECHGGFHNGAGAGLGVSDDDSMTSPWIRHPTDIDMNTVNGTEYAGYNDPSGSGTNNYSIIAPVGSLVVTAPLGTVLNAAGDAIVMCISCHRPHGSANADLLRWDYSAINAHSSAAGTNNTGCFICHTTKDDQ